MSVVCSSYRKLSSREESALTLEQSFSLLLVAIILVWVPYQDSGLPV
jgi:hypothetical protein